MLQAQGEDCRGTDIASDIPSSFDVELCSEPGVRLLVKLNVAAKQAGQPQDLPQTGPELEQRLSLSSAMEFSASEPPRG